MTATAALKPAGRAVSLRGRTFSVVVPKRSDPRLKLSATLAVLTVFGLTILRFQVSIPQILVCILSCALIEFAITLIRQKAIVWPASAIQTGVSVAFIFRIAGTQHGDLWTLSGAGILALVASGSLLSKYLVKLNGRHVFNPSNIGLVWGLLLIGPSHVFTEHLWWKPLGPTLIVSLAVIFGGAYWILRQVKMIRMATEFMVAFAGFIAILALSGAHFYARWHQGPVGGFFYWTTVAVSPEVLIFAFFMITDPQTAPKARAARLMYAVSTAAVAAGLIALQDTEFGIKASILSSLVTTCALVPAFAALAARKPLRLSLRAIGRPVIVAIAVVALAAPVDVALIGRDQSIVLIEQGLTTRHVQ